MELQEIHNTYQNNFQYKEYISIPHYTNIETKIYDIGPSSMKLQLYAWIKCPTRMSVNDIYLMYKKFDYPKIIKYNVGTNWVFIIDMMHNGVYFQFPN